MKVRLHNFLSVSNSFKLPPLSSPVILQPVKFSNPISFLSFLLKITFILKKLFIAYDPYTSPTYSSSS